MTERLEPLHDLTVDDVERLIVGYDSKQRYDVSWDESPQRTAFVLELVELDEPFVKRWSLGHVTSWYRGLLGEGLSFGAWIGDELSGIAITERWHWNDQAMVWELHVGEPYRGRGIGRRLLQSVERAAKPLGIRAVVLETQTTNVAAIGFYRACGYSLQAIDLSFYANTDHERGEVAVFMKKTLD